MAFANPVSFRCHQAPLDRPLTVGMVVDAPHNPGQIVSSDRFPAPSGLVPARLFRCPIADVGGIRPKDLPALIECKHRFSHTGA